VEALEEQLNEQEERGDLMERELAKLRADTAAQIASLQRTATEAEEAAQRASDEASTGSDEVEAMKATIARLTSIEKEKEELAEVHGNLLSKYQREMKDSEGKMSELKQLESAAKVRVRELELKVEEEEARRAVTEKNVAAMAEEHKGREAEYHTRVEAMRENMEMFEETISALQAEGFNQSMEGNMQQEIAGIESLVEAASDEVQEKDKEIERLMACIEALEADRSTDKENQSTPVAKSQKALNKKAEKADVGGPRVKHITEAKNGIYERNKARAMDKMSGFASRRMPTPAKEPSNGLPNTIARMQQTLQNLRGCANKMKESGRSSVKQRMELSERAMHAYRELKELTTV